MPVLRRLTSGRRWLAEWEHMLWVWDVLLVAGVAILVATLAMDGEDPPYRRAGGAVALGLQVAWYLAFGRRVILYGREDGGPAWAFVTGVIVLFGAAVGFDDVSWSALAVIVPLVFLSLSLPRAIPAVVVLSLLPPVVVGVRDDSWDTSLWSLPGALLSLAFAVLVGTFIDRTTRRSAARAELIRELEASRAEVVRLSHAAGAAAERARWAAEIHDTLAQGFASIITLLQAADADLDGDNARARRRMDLAVRAARENLAEARALVNAGAPLALESRSLDDAVRRLAERTSEELAIPVTFEVDGASRSMPTAVEVVLLRAVQEGLSNVRKHAEASSVTVRLSYCDDSVSLVVSDDGRGFREDGVVGGFGLPSMRKRVEQVGGSVTVHSAIGSGSAIRVEVPAVRGVSP